MNWDDLSDGVKKSMKYGTLNEVKIYELNLPEKITILLGTGKILFYTKEEFIAMIKAVNQNNAIDLWRAAFNVTFIEANEAVKFVFESDYIKL